MTPRFNLRLLGPIQVEQNGEPVHGFKSRKTLALLGYLATENQPISRAYLVELFWPDSSETRGRNNLSQALHNLNALWPNCVQADWYTVQFQPAGAYELDIRQFNRLIATGEIDDLTQAVALYRGDFMAQTYLDDCPEFEQWLRLTQETWRRRVLQALQNLVDCYTRANNLAQALNAASRMVAIDPGEEEGHRQKMLLLACSGQRSAALAEYETCRRFLREELDVEPAAETRALYDQLRQGELGADSAAADRRAKSLRLWPTSETFPRPAFNNLPAPSTSFIGRETELAIIRHYLENPACRLITIVGLGGIGKTRLALRAAAAMHRFTHGVCFIPLASTHSPPAIISTMADALNFAYHNRSDLKTQLFNFLGPKNMLLIMDNFDHLIDGAELLVELLEQAPQLKIMVTSRERLGLPAEWILDLQGLSYPGHDQSRNLENYSAIQLFLHRARQVRADFWLTFLDKPAVARICQLVEGLPLAIELAAAWTRTFSCQDIALEIEKNYIFLTASLPNIAKRHQSLRAVFEHSWQFLSEAEQQALRRLSIFRKGFSRGSAEQVAGASPVLLSALVDKSLLRWTSTERYEMHELLRQYSAEKLAETPREKEKVQDRHCQYFAAFLRDQEIQFKKGEQQTAVARIGAEIDNIRIGWQWAVSHLWTKEIEQYLEGLFLFYNIRSRFHEGETLFREASLVVRRAAEAPHRDSNKEIGKQLGQILARQGLLAASLGKYEEARVIMQESLALLDEPDIRLQIPQTLNYLGATALMLGEHLTAKRLCQESLMIAKAAADWWKEGTALEYLSLIAMSLGEYLEAQELAQQSLTIFRRFDYRSGIACALNMLGITARVRGEYTEAKQLCQESLQIAREIDDRWQEALALEYLAKIALSLGEYAEAKALAQESLDIFKNFGYNSGTLIALNLLGKVKRRLGQYAEAQQLHEQVLQNCQELNYRPGIAFASYQLGYLAYLQGNYPEAKRQLNQGLEISEKLAYQWGIARSLNILGRVAGELGNYQTAQQYFRQALKMAQTFQAIPLMLDILTGLATNLIKKNHLAQAIEILTFILYHPASAQETRDEANQLRTKLLGDLPEQVVIPAQEKGLTGTMEQMIAQFRVKNVALEPLAVC